MTEEKYAKSQETKRRIGIVKGRIRELLEFKVLIKKTNKEETKHDDRFFTIKYEGSASKYKENGKQCTFIKHDAILVAINSELYKNEIELKDLEKEFDDI